MVEKLIIHRPAHRGRQKVKLGYCFQKYYCSRIYDFSHFFSYAAI